ncbi:MAG TPA: putative peptidoglycan glycosyltransferase FtsW [Anaerolineae bacterium]
MAARIATRFQLFPPRSAEATQKRPVIDLALLGIVAALLAVGIMMIYSVSFGPRVQGGTNDPYGLFVRQLEWIGLGLACMVVMWRLDYHIFERLALPIMGLTLVLLIVVIPYGNLISRQFFGGSVQPGEIAKLASIIYIATWLASKANKLRNWLYGMLPFGIIVGAVAGLVAIEPNLSTAILIALTAFAIFFIANANLIHFTVLALVGGSAAVLVVTQYQRGLERFGLWTGDPIASTSEKVWQLRETLIALGSGGLIGKGLLSGGGQYGWVPLAHTDTILAIWGEETGLAGVLFLLGVYMFLFYRGFQIAARASDDLGRFLASGVTFWIFFQMFVHMGVITQTIPFTGQPLPFISYGGSSMIVSLTGMGILLSVARGPTKKTPARAKAESPAREERGTPEREIKVATKAVRSREKHATSTLRRWDRRPRLPNDGGPSVRKSTRPRPRR